MIGLTSKISNVLIFFFLLNSLFPLPQVRAYVLPEERDGGDKKADENAYIKGQLLVTYWLREGRNEESKGIAIDDEHSMVVDFLTKNVRELRFIKKKLRWEPVHSHLVNQMKKEGKSEAQVRSSVRIKSFEKKLKRRRLKRNFRKRYERKLKKERTNKTHFHASKSIILSFKGKGLDEFELLEKINNLKNFRNSRITKIEAEINYRYKAFDIPNDSRYGEKWSLQKVEAHKAWDITKGDPNVVVAIIDTGVDFNHEDLKDNIWVNTGEIPDNGIDDDGNGYVDDVRGWNFVNNDNSPLDDHRHGTHVAGIVAADDNDIGVRGIAPDCRIMPLKAGGGNANFTVSAIVEAVAYAVDNGADVINMSLGFSPESPSLAREILQAHEDGVIIIAAAGNDNFEGINYPAASDRVLSVAATGKRDGKAWFSTYGEWVDVAAPGDRIISTMPGSYYDNMSGTSMASPFVAGLAALIISQFPDWSNREVEKQILEMTDNIDIHTPPYIGKLGAGRVNARNALLTLPNLHLTIQEIDDDNRGESHGNNNGIIEQGETIELKVDIKNTSRFGLPSGQRAEFLLTTDDPYTEILQDSLILSEIEPYEEFHESPSFLIRVSKEKPLFEKITLNLEATTSGIRLKTVQFDLQANFIEKPIVMDRNIYAIRIDGERLFWLESFGSFYPLGLGSYNLKTEDEIAFEDGCESYDVSFPYVACENHDNDISLIDLRTNEVQLLTSDGYIVKQKKPSIDGNHVIWHETRDRQTDIVVYSLKEETSRLITSDPQVQDQAVLHGEKIIWREPLNNSGWHKDVFLYDLKTDLKRQLTDDEANQWNLDIFDNNVVYWDRRNGNGDVFLYDLEKNLERQLTDNPQSDIRTSLHKDKILFKRENELYLFDLSRDKEYQITHRATARRPSAVPQIFGNKIVWLDSRYVGHDLFLGTYSIPDEFLYGDFNGDGRVDCDDASFFQSCKRSRRRRLSESCQRVDFNGNGRVDLQDEEKMAENFTCSQGDLPTLRATYKIPQTFYRGENVLLSLEAELGLSDFSGCPLEFSLLSALDDQNERVQVTLSKEGLLRLTPEKMGSVFIQVKVTETGSLNRSCREFRTAPTIIINIDGRFSSPTPSPSPTPHQRQSRRRIRRR